MDTLRQAKEVALKTCSEQKTEIESLTEQLNSAKQKLASTSQKLQVAGKLFVIVLTLAHVGFN